MPSITRRTTALAAIVGGIAWTAATVLHASRPVGCVGSSCATTPMRESGTAEAALVAVGLVSLLLAVAGLVAASPRRAGRPHLEAVLAVAGVVGLLAAIALNATGVGSRASWMPIVVGPAILTLVAGIGLTVRRVLRSAVVPRPVGLALAVATVALLGANEQTAAAWLAVPFGLAWVAVGASLHTRSAAGQAA